MGSSGGVFSSSSSLSASVSLAVVACSSSDEGSSTCSPAPSGPTRELSLMCTCSVGACNSSGLQSMCVKIVYAWDEQNPWWLDENTFYFLGAYAPAQGCHCRKHTTKAVNDIHRRHSRRGIPYLWRHGKKLLAVRRCSRLCEANAAVTSCVSRSFDFYCNDQSKPLQGSYAIHGHYHSNGKRWFVLRAERCI